jgi:rhodanese-related sulfurtransferase
VTAGTGTAIKTVDNLLAQARSRLRRLNAQQAHAAFAAGASLIDIRAESQRAAGGIVPGSHFVPRNVLEWRLDPLSPWRKELAPPGACVIVMCQEGLQSSLAAATLCDFGLDVTDMIDGFKSWRDAGLPVEPLSYTELPAVAA